MDKELEESTAEKAFEEMSNNPAADSDPENNDKNAGDSEDIEK